MFRKEKQEWVGPFREGASGLDSTFSSELLDWPSHPTPAPLRLPFEFLQATGEASSNILNETFLSFPLSDILLPIK